MSEFPSCVSSTNLICKHARSTETFYVNLDFMRAGVTAISATAETADVSLTVEGIEVLDADLTVDPSHGCDGAALIADRALLLVLSGGTPSDEEVIVTVSWVQSDGDEMSRDCRVLVQGTAA